MSIQPLPETVIAQIKSSTTITTLNGVICGLIKNSLDAGATKITISLDYVRGNCSIEDNGTGIRPDEFEYSGGLGKLHFTSKFPPQDGIHGKYGTFIASLASLSLLSITSHHHEYHSHNSIQIHNSSILARQTPSPPEQRILSFPYGTRVTVRDLFGLMPVRVKQRAIDAERGVHSKDWESLRRDIIALTLSYPGSVSFLIRESANQWAFSIRANEPTTPRRDGKIDALNLTKRVSKVLHQAQISDENNPEAWIPLEASAGMISVIGAVSLHPIATKKLQFISIGIQPVPNEHGSNVLYEEINRVFSNSSFGMEEQVENINKDERERRAKDSRYKNDGFTSQELKGRKGVDRWPMFYIKIQFGERKSSLIPHEIDEFLDERHGSLTAIIDLLKAVVYEFLKKHHFRPKRIKAARENITRKTSKQGSTSKSLSRNPSVKAATETEIQKKHDLGDLATTRLSIRCDRGLRPRPESPFDLWTRIKSGSPSHTLVNQNRNKECANDDSECPSCCVSATSESNAVSYASDALFASDGNLLRAPFVGPVANIDDRGQEPRPSSRVDNINPEEGVRWTNPATKETLIINSRTGFVVQPPENNLDHLEGKRESENFVPHKRLRSQIEPASTGDQSAWLKALLSSWDNPIFHTTELRIPSVFSEGNILSQPMQLSGRDSPEARPSILGRVSKSALRSAEVIAQVDRKFILAKVLVDSSAQAASVPNAMASLLIIVDQHAADERCRVEALMKDYFVDVDGKELNEFSSLQPTLVPRVCLPRVQSLDRPIKFDVSARDMLQFKRTTKYFTDWGIHYDVVPVSQAGNSDHGQVRVTRLPISIAERCRLEPRLLIELLRNESWKANEKGNDDSYKSTPKRSGSEGGETAASHWLARLHGCPEGILDMMNSRACRSSIMFNDLLSYDDCVNLLRRLADCAFPFQCAHGRPSMVPLVDLGNKLADIHDGRKQGGSFGKEFRKWKNT
ncbi:hypothetical protein F5Y19DRAFT_411709 [Xylariaceae sp. FL1651]|nr:hypothetical protein F5Y19DRAFT_411709 [Xylariaceae sp. FL1651]